MASLFQSRYTYFPEEVVLTLPSKYIFSGKSIVLHFLLPFLYKIEFFILPVCNIAISCKFAKNSATSCTSVEFMAEVLTIATGNKAERYATLLPQMTALLEGETDLIAGMANLSAALSQTFGFFWTGFYRVLGDKLVLGPFQGPIACTRIAFGKGVCGTAWERAETVIVPDVDAFPGHIACNSASRSEIVVPVKADGKVIAVLDIDSDQLNMFDEVDQYFLEQMVALLTAHRAL